MPSDEITFTNVSAGSVSWIKNFAIPTCDLIEESAFACDWTYIETGQIDAKLRISTRPKADLGVATAFVVGCLAFAGSWAATKVLDEFYQSKLRPKLIELFRRLEKGPAISRHDRVFHFSIHWTNLSRTVVVGIVAASLEEASEHMDLVLEVHRRALDQILRSPGMPIHLYTISDGRVNLSPDEFETLESAMQKLCG